MKLRIQVSKNYQVLEVETDIPQGVKASEVSAKLRAFANAELGKLIDAQEAMPNKKNPTDKTIDKKKFGNLMLSDAQIHRLTKTMGYTEADIKDVKEYKDLEPFMTKKKLVLDTQIKAKPQVAQVKENEVPWEIDL